MNPHLLQLLGRVLQHRFACWVGNDCIFIFLSVYTLRGKWEEGEHESIIKHLTMSHTVRWKLLWFNLVVAEFGSSVEEGKGVTQQVGFQYSHL